MGKGKLLVLMLCILSLTLFSACEFPMNLDNGGCNGSSTDPTTDTDTDNIIDADPDDGDTGGDDSIESTIRLNGDSITADSANASVSETIVTITAAGTYNISGSLSDGQIIVDAPDTDVVRLNLNGVDIKCSDSAPIFIANADKTIVTLGDNSRNKLTDGTSYVLDAGEDEPNAALFSKDDLTIKGDGALTVTGNYNDGIASKNDLRIKGGNITVKASDDGLRGKDSIEISGGDITVTAGGDGLTSDNEEEADRGMVLIEAGNVTVSAAGDGISAETTVSVIDGNVKITTASRSDDTSAKGIKGNAGIAIDGGTFDLNCADDAIHSNGDIVISGGTFTLASGDDAIRAENSVEINGGDIQITKSYEGIEGTSIIINDGNIHLVSSDDGINAADKEATGGGGWPAGPGGGFSANAYVHFNGGYLAMNANGDGLDSNGSMEMTGGTAIVHGPTANNNGPMDYGSFNITGGLIVAAGSAGMAQIAGSTSSSQNALLLNFSSTLAAGTLVNVQTDAGRSILTFAPKKRFQSITFSSPELVRGTSYRVYTGGNSSGTEKDGLYVNGTYSGGTQYTTFTVSSAVTTIGSRSGFPRP